MWLKIVSQNFFDWHLLGSVFQTRVQFTFLNEDAKGDLLA